MTSVAPKLDLDGFASVTAAVLGLVRHLPAHGFVRPVAAPRNFGWPV
jgi:hypothetical protein